MRLTRRSFTAGFTSTFAAAAAGAVLPKIGFAALPSTPSPFHKAISLSGAWNVYASDHLVAANVTLPHVPVALSWRNWDPVSWQKVWTYRRSLDLPDIAVQQRLFLSIERAMVNATVRVNGREVGSHHGGFLPFDCEISGAVRTGANQIEIEVDSRWLDEPPAGSPKGPAAVDYYLPGGIHGAVELRSLPRTAAVVDLWAHSRDVLSGEPSLEIFAEIESDQPRTAVLTCRLSTGGRLVQQSTTSAMLARGRSTVNAQLSSLRGIELWSPDHPKLYNLVIEVEIERTLMHAASKRIGFREARFSSDGFYLNGKKTRLFGLNRHELFPYVGFAASPRSTRHDAAYLRNELNCNMVRCSHYPQSIAFLDACDELGLMVWEEIPGWQYLGDQAWKRTAVQNTQEMIRRDRHHPSIIVWGTRINESANDPDLYNRTREIARHLDPTRPTSGSMTASSRADWKEHWHQDIFAFDDYHAAPDGTVGIDPALPGVPYMLAETVGQYSYGTANNFLRRYRRAGIPEEQNAQALLHAQAHDRAAQDERNAGVLAWCAFDYASPIHSYQGVKCPGVVDTFREPKLGAAFYRSQITPEQRVVLEPSFYWDAKLHVADGRAAIFSNCDQLRISLNGTPHSTLLPDANTYPRLHYPPFFADLPWHAIEQTVLRIDGYIAGRQCISRSFDGAHARDRLWMAADDRTIRADGVDSTRISFGIADSFGNPRPEGEGILRVEHRGAGQLVGDTTFPMSEGAVAAVWLRSLPDRTGRADVTIVHPGLGRRSISVQIRRETRSSSTSSADRPPAPRVDTSEEARASL